MVRTYHPDIYKGEDADIRMKDINSAYDTLTGKKEMSFKRNNKNKKSWDLIDAIVFGDINLVKTLMERGVDLNARDEAGQTPLIYAILHERIEIIKILITGINGNSGNRYDMNLDSDSLLKSNLVDVNARNIHNMTALHEAAFKGYTDIVELLISAGAEVNARNNHDQTPLHQAAFKGYTDIFEVLISAGAEVNARDKDGKTPLHFAVWFSRKDAVEKLISAGVEVNIKDRNDKTPLHWAAEAATTFLWASDGIREIVELLISKGVNVNAKDSFGMTALDIVKKQKPNKHTIFAEQQNTYKEVVKLLKRKMMMTKAEARGRAFFNFYNSCKGLFTSSKGKKTSSP